jgi:glycosyltransferase involved in cell wall biosynthesis
VTTIQTPRASVSVIILTLDEEVNIRACMESLAWADDVIVVDSGSRDKTILLARQARSDVRMFTHSFQNFGDQRNWALDHTQPKHEWILFLDADERCTPACANAIQSAVQNPGNSAGFFLTCRNYFLGRWIKHCSFYPSWQLRLLKAGQVRFRKEGHGQREVSEGSLRYIPEPYNHFGFSKGIEHWIARHNIYSTNEVELIRQLRQQPLDLKDLFCPDPVRRRRTLKSIAARTGCRPLFRFVYMYVFRAGFLDGYPGFVFCMLRVSHEIHITAKLAESRSSSCRTS